ncbi:MAG: sodium:calcium antiporter [Streptomycetales bacterium]
MLAGLGLLTVSAVLLAAGAEMFAGNAASAARKLGVSVLAVGILLAGAEPEEMLTAVLAALEGRPGLAAGDVIGANITMLTAALGLAALTRPLPFGSRVRGYAALSAVAGGCALLALSGGHVGRVAGLLLLLAYAGLVALVWWREKAPPTLGELAEEADREGLQDTPEVRDTEGARRSAATGLVLCAVGVVLMLAGGNVAVGGAVRLVEALGQSDTAVGLTLLALATTAELFALVVAAARHGVSELAVAGVVGSATYNATASLGAAALARPLDVPGMTGPALVAAALPLAVVALAARGHLGRAAGALLCGAYAAYLALVLLV